LFINRSCLFVFIFCFLFFMLTKLEPMRFLCNTTFVVYFENLSRLFCLTVFFQRCKITNGEILVQYHVYSIFCNPSSDRFVRPLFFCFCNVTKLQLERFSCNTTFIVYFVILHQTALPDRCFLFLQHYKNITGNISAQYHKYSIFAVQ